jgi:hypothetical protein
MVARLDKEQLIFERVKCHRDWYLAEYQPPIPGYPFASLQLTIIEPSGQERVAAAMERELPLWLKQYPVPVMVSSFDEAGNLNRIEPARPCNHLFGWLDPTTNVVTSHWRIVASDEFPPPHWSLADLRAIYRDIPARTSRELKHAARSRQRSLRFGWWIFFLWAAVVPVVIILVEFNAPAWLAWAALFYSLARAYIKAMRLLGWWPASHSETATTEEERRMHHHHYHCERNPEGFHRLVSENLKREAREQIRREAEALKSTRTNQ